MSRLTRRTTIKGLLAVLALAPEFAAACSSAQRRFVFVNLRGALDGLAAVPPYGDRAYRGARSALALSAPGKRTGIVDLDGFFGLHPALAPLHAFYAARQMIVMPAVATAYRDQHHATGRTYLDRGEVSDGASSWLDRAQMLLTGDGATAPWRMSPEMMVNGDPDLIANLCHNNPDLARLLTEREPAATVSEQVPAADFRRAALQAGEALASPGGPRLALLESFGWDTHADQGRDTGRLATALAGLADGLVALSVALGDAWRDTAVLVATEFGRSVRMNSMGGTDHGGASAAFLIGGAVSGGGVLGSWPGLAEERLHWGKDLVPTLDLHAIARAALIQHVGLPQAAVDQFVLPGQAPSPSPVSLFTA